MTETHTYIAPPGKTSSPVSLKLTTEWKVLEENFGSDHKAILISVNKIVPNNTLKKKTKVDENKFKNYIDLVNTDNLNVYEDCEREILGAIQYSKIHHKNLNSTSYIYKPWYGTRNYTNKKIIQLKALRKFNKFSTSEKFLNLKRELASSKRIKKRRNKKVGEILLIGTNREYIWKSINHIHQSY